MRQEVSGKCFRMSEVSRGLKKCTDASEWCREAQKVWKGVKFGNQEGAGKLQGRIPSGRSLGGARCSQYSNCRMYRKEASFIL